MKVTDNCRYVAGSVFCRSVEPMDCGDDRIAGGGNSLHSFLSSKDEAHIGEKSSAKHLRYCDDNGIIPEGYWNDGEFESRSLGDKFQCCGFNVNSVQVNHFAIQGKQSFGGYTGSGYPLPNSE